ncbi:MAG: J domain-containing protein [Limisphaerales bacterium]
MDREQLQQWLNDRIASERRNQLGFAFVGGASGIAVTTLTAGLGTGAVYLAIHQVMEIGRAFWGWQGSFEATVLNLACIAVAFLALQLAGMRRATEDYVFYLPQVDWRASQNVGVVIATIWAILLDLVYSGPRLIRFSYDRLCLRCEFDAIDREICVGVLHAIHCQESRVSFIELEDAVPGFDEMEHLRQLLLIKGVMNLKSDPPGLSINSDLRKEFGSPSQKRHARAKRREASGATKDTNQQSRESRGGKPKADKPPAFRCVGCRRKFRLRNLQGGVDFNCPMCGESYRTTADSHGHVRVERQSDEYDPTVNIEFGTDIHEAYLTLGLTPGATKDEVKQAYRRLMKEYHPDKATQLSSPERKHFEERSKRINQAYGEILDELR